MRDAFQLNVYQDRNGVWRASTNTGRGKSHSIRLSPSEAEILKGIAGAARDAEPRPPVSE